MYESKQILNILVIANSLLSIFVTILTLSAPTKNEFRETVSFLMRGDIVGIMIALLWTTWAISPYLSTLGFHLLFKKILKTPDLSLVYFVISLVLLILTLWLYLYPLLFTDAFVAPTSAYRLVPLLLAPFYFNVIAFIGLIIGLIQIAIFHYFRNRNM